PDQLETIFEPFKQAETLNHSSSDGLGLGLYLSRKMAQMHGGSLVASSAGPGQGSTFTLHLPDCMACEETQVTAPQHPAQTQVPQRTDPQSFEAASGEPLRKVLVVDDHEDSAQSMALLIDSWGFPVQVASNGREGLAKVLEWQPDVVFMDVRMPVMDGLEMARRIRTESLAAQPLLVALTGFGQKEDIERSLQAGANAHLVKPADPVRLKALIEAGRV
ncbi:MAG: response regulator, partial [Burkholderiales bacterium]